MIRMHSYNIKKTLEVSGNRFPFYKKGSPPLLKTEYLIVTIWASLHQFLFFNALWMLANSIFYVLS